VDGQSSSQLEDGTWANPYKTIGAALAACPTFVPGHYVVWTVLIATGVVFLLFIPYPVTQYIKTGNPLPGNTQTARGWLNIEKLQNNPTPEFRQAIKKNLYHGGPLSPLAYMFSGRTVFDVVVTDGFTGNLVLKTIEAVMWDGKPAWWQGVCGGARLLGIRGSVIISHGSSTADDIRRAVIYAGGVGG